MVLGGYEQLAEKEIMHMVNGLVLLSGTLSCGSELDFSCFLGGVIRISLAF